MGVKIAISEDRFIDIPSTAVNNFTDVSNDIAQINEDIGETNDNVSELADVVENLPAVKTTVQELTSSEKQQARTNIDVLYSSYKEYIYYSTDTENPTAHGAYAKNIIKLNNIKTLILNNKDYGSAHLSLYCPNNAGGDEEDIPLNTGICMLCRMGNKLVIQRNEHRSEQDATQIVVQNTIWKEGDDSEGWYLKIHFNEYNDTNEPVPYGTFALTNIGGTIEEIDGDIEPEGE